MFFKCENLQKTGAFKARGACNAVLKAKEDLGDGLKGELDGFFLARKLKQCVPLNVTPNNVPYCLM